MPKEDVIEVDGVVAEILPGGQFRVQLDGSHVVLVYTAGKMRKGRIRTALGDRVRVEMTPYDLSRGRLVYRYRGDVVPTAQPRHVYRPRR